MKYWNVKIIIKQDGYEDYESKLTIKASYKKEAEKIFNSYWDEFGPSIMKEHDYENFLKNRIMSSWSVLKTSIHIEEQKR
jgi:hypothetical protein